MFSLTQFFRQHFSLQDDLCFLNDVIFADIQPALSIIESSLVGTLFNWLKKRHSFLKNADFCPDHVDKEGQEDLLIVAGEEEADNGEDDDDPRQDKQWNSEEPE